MLLRRRHLFNRAAASRYFSTGGEPPSLDNQEALQRSLSNNATRMERNKEEWRNKSSRKGISRLYRDYRIGALSDEPSFDPKKNKYDVDTDAPPPFLFSSAKRVFSKPPKVILTSDIAELARTPFERAGFRVDLISPDLSQSNSLQTLAADCHLLGIGPSTVLGEQFFKNVGYQPHRLWAVGHFGGGTKGIHLQAASARGVACFHARNASSRSVAEKTVADIVALQRQIQKCSHAMHHGEWNPSTMGREIRGMTLGIVGYGRVGRQVSIMAETLGMRVLFHERKQDVLELGNAERSHDLDEMLRRCDCLSLHMSGGGYAAGMTFIGKRELGLLRRGSIVINNGVSDAVDVDALAAALRSGHVAGAAVDAFRTRPEEGEKFRSPLRGLPNVILTPGIAGMTVDADRAAAKEVSAKLMEVMQSGSTATCVNLPQVEVVRPARTAHRIVHMHRSVPGVMSNINSVIASTGANIHGQLLQTDGSHGYVVLDVGRSQAKSVERGQHREMMRGLKSRLKSVPHTMYVRSMLRSDNTFGVLSPETMGMSGSMHQRDLVIAEERIERRRREDEEEEGEEEEEEEEKSTAEGVRRNEGHVGKKTKEEEEDLDIAEW